MGIPKPAKDTIFTHIGRHPVNRQKMAVVNPPGGKTAITDYEVLATDAATITALVLCHLHTGRTHQIRVHLHHKGTPLLGDPIYGKPSKDPVLPDRLMLHAWRLSFRSSDHRQAPPVRSADPGRVPPVDRQNLSRLRLRWLRSPKPDTCGSNGRISPCPTNSFPNCLPRWSNNLFPRKRNTWRRPSQRLLKAGLEEDEAKRQIAYCLSEEMFEILRQKRPFDEKAYRAALDELPLAPEDSRTSDRHWRLRSFFCAAIHAWSLSESLFSWVRQRVPSGSMSVSVPFE